MKLVDNARQAWRWFSVQAFVIQGAAASAWLAVPDDLRAAVPGEWLAAAAVAMSVAGTIGRLVKQPGAQE